MPEEVLRHFVLVFKLPGEKLKTKRHFLSLQVVVRFCALDGELCPYTVVLLVTHLLIGYPGQSFLHVRTVIKDQGSVR